MRVVLTYPDGTEWRGDVIAYLLLPPDAVEHTRVRLEPAPRETP